MQKKVNVTKDLESRRKIARMLLLAAKATMPEKTTLHNEPPKTQTPDTAKMDAAGRDKKPGRKADGKP